VRYAVPRVIKSSRQVADVHLNKIVLKQGSCISLVRITIVNVKYGKSSSSVTAGQSYDPAQQSAFCFKPKMHRKLQVWYLTNRGIGPGSPRAVGESPSLEGFKNRVDAALQDMV